MKISATSPTHLPRGRRSLDRRQVAGKAFDLDGRELSGAALGERGGGKAFFALPGLQAYLTKVVPEGPGALTLD